MPRILTDRTWHPRARDPDRRRFFRVVERLAPHRLVALGNALEPHLVALDQVVTRLRALELVAFPSGTRWTMAPINRLVREWAIDLNVDAPWARVLINASVMTWCEHRQVDPHDRFRLFASWGGLLLFPTRNFPPGYAEDRLPKDHPASPIEPERALTWDPTLEAEERFRERVENYVAHVRDRAEHYGLGQRVADPQSEFSQRDFEWLVRRHALGQSDAEISALDETGRNGPSQVQARCQRLRDWLGLPLPRARRGRRPNSPNFV